MKKLSGFGEVFKLFRVENGLSGSVLAEKVGKSQSYISAIENNEITNLPFDFLKTCMDTFGLQKAERHKFLVSAMENSKEIKIPLDNVSIIPPERFIKLLAYILDNYDPPFQSDQSWIRNSLYSLKNDITYSSL